ncbi:MAG: VCBS repeat-containing protein [Myxococcales bacterium]|nr:VCBS repeat-containing protein [Myxococcales bacterium]
MPLTVQTVAVPTGVADVRFADVDGDDVAEILLLSRQSISGQPDAASLTVVRPTEPARGVVTVSLGNRPLFVSPAPEGSSGMWALGASAWQRWETNQFVAAGAVVSPLAQLGRATPVFAELVKGVFPGAAARITWSGGNYVCVRSAAPEIACGSVPAPAQGQLSASLIQGGQVLATTLTPPALTVTDADGDGYADLLMPDHKQIAVYFTGADAVGVRAARWPVPLDLQPPEGPREKGESRREVGNVWLEDIDGDHKVDLGVLRYVTNGSFFGATAEWLYAHGTGSGFEALKTVSLPSAAFGATLVDVDGDGDKDLVTGLVDIGMRNLATALLSHVVRADLAVLRCNGTAGFAPPAVLHGVSFPLDQSDAFHVDFEGDVDGDKHVDLVAAEDGTVNVYRGSANGMDSAASWSAEIEVPRGQDTLLTHDIDGDGKAEIVVWGKDAGKVWILRR